jgi:hypothetical protein
MVDEITEPINLIKEFENAKVNAPNKKIQNLSGLLSWEVFCICFREI